MFRNKIIHIIQNSEQPSAICNSKRQINGDPNEPQATRSGAGALNIQPAEPEKGTPRRTTNSLATKSDQDNSSEITGGAIDKMAASKVKKPTRKQKTPELLKTVEVLANAGFNPPQIAEQTGISRITAWKWLREISKDDKSLSQHKSALADHFAESVLDNLNLSARLTKRLANMPDDVLDNMNPVNVAALKRTADVGAGISHDHYRAESGQSTSNVLILHADIAALKAAEAVDK